ncbi:predicted protein [Nematostella vectensis]|uniref:SAM domain-containing protein n=1 Tax=Nematostella vectensis TaxID=45351 RepID=A7S3U9_NEMVE|nr:predicted protein [Nematostella vectensis]|eukprot:XP_001633662.1 predicted protein [Nematostella vectensis]
MRTVKLAATGMRSYGQISFDRNAIIRSNLLRWGCDRTVKIAAIGMRSKTGAGFFYCLTFQAASVIGPEGGPNTGGFQKFSNRRKRDDERRRESECLTHSACYLKGDSPVPENTNDAYTNSRYAVRQYDALQQLTRIIYTDKKKEKTQEEQVFKEKAMELVVDVDGLEETFEKQLKLCPEVRELKVLRPTQRQVPRGRVKSMEGQKRKIPCEVVKCTFNGEEQSFTQMASSGAKPKANSLPARFRHKNKALQKPRELKTLSESEVCECLQDFGLGGYVEKFAKERIDGSLFACLDKDSLNELDVANSFHQDLIMRIVEQGYWSPSMETRNMDQDH